MSALKIAATSFLEQMGFLLSDLYRRDWQADISHPLYQNTVERTIELGRDAIDSDSVSDVRVEHRR